jgi:hypothetical protein
MKRQAIFIGGCERSGTTMLGSYLGKHPDLLVTPESQFKLELMRYTTEDGTIDLEQAMSYLRKEYRLSSWKISLDELATQLAGDSRIGYHELIEHIQDQYEEKHQPGETRFWVDHTPNNMRNGLRLNSLFPDAKFIHIVRDGRGVANSYRHVTWAPYETYFSAKDWVSKVGHGLALGHRLGPDKLLVTRYEDLLEDPQSEMSRICSFLGLNYDEWAAGKERFKVPDFSNKGLKKGNHNRWREGLSERDIRIFESITKDFLPCLGYNLLYSPSLQGISLGDKIVSGLREAVHIVQIRGQRMKRRWRRRHQRAGQ